MKPTLAVVSVAFFLAGELWAKWFLLPAAVGLLFLLIGWHDDNKGRKHLPYSIEALYATGVPALFTCAGWLPATVRLLSDPTLEHLRDFALNPFLITVASSYGLFLWAFSKDKRHARRDPIGNAAPTPAIVQTTSGAPATPKRMPRSEDFWREQRAAPDSAAQEARAKTYLRYTSKPGRADHA